MTTRRLIAVSPVAGVAGGETSLLRLLPALRERGWTTELTVPAKGRLLSAARDAGIRARRLPLGPPERRTLGSYAGAALAPALLVRADVVLLNGLSAQRVVPALHAVRRRAVLRVNNPLERPPAAWGRRGFWTRVRCVLADSAHVAAECIAAGAPPELVVTAYPAAWPSGEPPPPRSPDEPDGERVGFLGQLEERKGVAELIEAAAGFLSARPRASVTVFGDPREEGDASYASAVRDHAARTAVGGRIRFAGHVTDPYEALSKLDLIVVPSLSEPFGTIAAEAAAAGLPTVASDVGGLREVVIDGETGVLVAPGDSAALAEAVASLLADEPRRRALGARGRQLSARFSPEVYASTVDAALRRVAAEGVRE